MYGRIAIDEIEADDAGNNPKRVEVCIYTPFLAL